MHLQNTFYNVGHTAVQLLQGNKTSKLKGDKESPTGGYDQYLTVCTSIKTITTDYLSTIVTVPFNKVPKVYLIWDQFRSAQLVLNELVSVVGVWKCSFSSPLRLILISCLCVLGARIFLVYFNMTTKRRKRPG